MTRFRPAFDIRNSCRTILSRFVVDYQTLDIFLGGKQGIQRPTRPCPLVGHWFGRRFRQRSTTIRVCILCLVCDPFSLPGTVRQWLYLCVVTRCLCCLDITLHLAFGFRLNRRRIDRRWWNLLWPVLWRSSSFSLDRLLLLLLSFCRRCCRCCSGPRRGRTDQRIRYHPMMLFRRHTPRRRPPRLSQYFVVLGRFPSTRRSSWSPFRCRWRHG